ncbi:hypothetical protein MPSEU_001010700 [Mayamaea pseudoterrestris]|nr:hypothetical protein MPSEU_001010700 [Mayamaea pseudoterrestris]
MICDYLAPIELLQAKIDEEEPMKDIFYVLKKRCQYSETVSAAIWLNDDDDAHGVENASHLSYAAALSVLEDHYAWISSHVQNCNASVIAYLANNSIDYILSVVTCSSPSIPSIPALLNVRWSVPEMVAALQSSNTSVTTILVYSTEMEATALSVQAKMNHKTVCLPLPLFSESRRIPLLPATERGSHSPYKNTLAVNDLSPEDAVVVFTSGTSGAAKGVRLGHRAILVQAQAKCQEPCNYDHDTKLLASTVPFYHIGGLSSLLAVWLAGGTLVFPGQLQATSFRPEQVIQSVSMSEHAAPNTLVVVPAMLYTLQQKVDELQLKASFPSVRLVLIGGQAASKQSLDFVARIFPDAQVVQTFACTEAASSLTFLNVNDAPTAKLPGGLSGDCVGSPPRHVQLGIVADDKQSMMPPFQLGSISFRGPCRMSGYWNRGNATTQQRSINLDSRWFVTNDLGFLDDQGRLYFAGRKTDTIRTGGETVFAAEVERVIVQHPMVDECAVFGLKDDRFGETVCCAVVCTSICPTLPALRSFCVQKGLARYKCPTRLFVLDALPKSSTGKVLKFRLVDTFKLNPRNKSKL